MHPHESSALTALQRLSLTIGTTLSLEEECAAFIQWVQAFLHPHLAALFVHDAQEEVLEFAAGLEVQIPNPSPLPIGHNPWEWFSAHKVVLPPEEAASRYVFPLSSEGGVIGILCLVHATALSEEQVQVLHIAAAFLGSALRNIRRYEDIENLVAERTAALRASEERYRAISETISDFAYSVIVTPEGRIQVEWVTDALFRVTGYSPEETSTMDGWLPLLVEEDYPQGLERRRRILQGEKDIAEFRIRYKDGSIHWLRDYSIPVWDEDEQRVVRVYGAAQDITAQKEMLHRLERRTAEANALLETARAITSLNLDEVLHTIATRARALFKTDGSRIHLLEPDGKTLRCVVALHEEAEAIMQMRISVGEGFTGQVAQTGEARIINDSEADGGGVHVPGTTQESESLMLAPLTRGENVIGVMTVTRLGTDRPFTPHDLGFLQAFAAQAAIAIANAQLFEKRTRFAAQMRALNELGGALLGARQESHIYELVAETLPHILPKIETIHILRQKTPDSEPQVAFSGNNPAPDVLQIAWETIRTRKIQRRERALCMPLIYGKNVLGSMCLHFSGEVHAEEEIPLQVCANLLAAALEDLRLFDEVQHQLEHMRAIHMITRTINASVDINVTLGVTLKQIRTHMNADAVAVFLMEEYSTFLDCRALETAAQQAASPALRLHMRNPAIQEAILSQKRTVIVGQDALMGVFTPREQVHERGWEHAEVMPLIARGQTRGLLLLLYCTSHTITRQEDEFLRSVARQTALGIEHSLLFERLQSTSMQLSTAQGQMLEHLALLVEGHLGEPAGTTRRMADLACKIAEVMHFSPEEITHLNNGLLLHDLGMLLIPEVQVHKAQPLSEEEWQVVRQHPALGYTFLKPLEFLHPAMDVIRYHHERLDGSGYPYGLSGTDIPLAARIAAAVDVWCALTSRRLWRPPFPPEEAARTIARMAGKTLDP
ncbi:MAG: GAF domain-containing protein, partial [Anaerolineae bacterium]